MKTNKLLVAAVLAIAIGAPIAGFAGDMKCGTADDIPRGTGALPARTSHRANSWSIRDWLLLSARTSGSIRRL